MNHLFPIKSVVLLILLFSITVLSGCAQQCREVEVKYYEKVPVLVNKTTTELEEYTYEEPVIIEDCSDRSFNITLGEKLWLNGKETENFNKLQRTIYINNIFNKLREFEFYKVFIYDGQVVEKTDGTYLQLVDANDQERLFVGWSTEYDPKKDVAIEVVRVSDTQTTSCLQEIRYVEKTGERYKTVLVEELVEDKNIVKTRIETVCT